jgi:arylsulfatase A-like enzyme
VTLAELLQTKGYFTAHVGKWHLGTAAYYPETQGYDVNVGGTFWGAPSTYFFPYRGIWSPADPELRDVPGLGTGEPDDYLTDRLTDKALEF